MPRVMKELDQDELVDCWTLVDNEPELVGTKRGAAKLGFALMLRFYTEKGRFPRGRAEVPDEAIAYVARQIGVERTEIAFYDFTSATPACTRCDGGREWPRHIVAVTKCQAEIPAPV